MADVQTNLSQAGVSGKDQREIQELYERLRAADAKIFGSHGKTQILPNTIASFLSQLLTDLKVGNSVTILQGKAALTTVEAGKLLGVSRQFLIGLLEKQAIPFHRVGTHRRFLARGMNRVCTEHATIWPMA